MRLIDSHKNSFMYHLKRPHRWDWTSFLRITFSLWGFWICRCFWVHSSRGVCPRSGSF